jgi:hypothetical protein
VEATTCHTDQVPDRHRDPTVTVRPTEQTKDAVIQLLAEHGLTLQVFVLACLAELLAEPERRLREVGPYVPEPKKKGRPPKPEAEPAHELEREPFEPPP